MNIAERIRSLRQQKNWTQEDMAEKLKISSNGYGNLERGTTGMTFHRLEQLAEIFGISLAELLNIDGKFILNQIGENCNHNVFNLDGKPFTESEYKYQLEKQQLIIESLQQEVSYLKEIIKLLRHGD